MKCFSLFFLLTFILINPLLNSVPPAYASPDYMSRAFIGYRSNTGFPPTLNTPKNRGWGTGSWGVESELADAGSAVQWVRVAYCPSDTRYYEKIAVTLSADGYLDAYVRTKTGWSVTNNIGNVGTGATRAFDVAYEKTTADALLAYAQPGVLATLTLRPNAAGTYQQWSTFGSGSAHWDRTSDQSDLTGVQVTTSTALKETEHLQDTSQTGPITQVTATMRAIAVGSKSGESAAIIWKLGASEVESSDQTIGRGAFADYSDTRTTDPAGGSWDWSDINSLEIGSRATGLATDEIIQVSEYWIVVTYTGPDLAYRIWNGSTWSTENYFDDPGHTTPLQYNWIALASKPTSGANEIAMIGLEGTNSDVNGWIWSGTAWGDYQELETSPSIDTEECIAVTYESTSGKAWFAYGTGSTIGFRRWNGAAWEAAISPTSVGGTVNWITAKSDPASDKIMVISVDGGSDLNEIYYDGSTWTLLAELDSAVDTNAARCADFEWEPSGSKGLIVWGATSGQINWKPFTPPSTWGAGGSPAMGADIHPWVQLRRNQRAVTGDMKILGAVLEDTVFDLGAIKWDGTTFTVIGASTFTADTTVVTYECFEMEFQPYYKQIPILSVDPATQSVDAAFTIEINITWGYKLYSWEFNVTYDTTKITATNVVNQTGNFLSSGGTIQFNKTINDANGWVWAYASLIGDVPGVTGNGILATVSFSIDATGTSTLDLHDSKLVEYDYVSKTSTCYPPNALKEVDGSVTVTVVVPEFPFGAALEIALAAVVIFIWWKRKHKTGPTSLSRNLP